MAWNSDCSSNQEQAREGGKSGELTVMCTGGISSWMLFLEGFWECARGYRRNLWKGGICSGPPECQHCLWQPDFSSSYTSKYELECPAQSTFDDLIHNPKRGIIRTIGSCFPCAAPCSQVLDPFAFISSRGIFHLPFYDLFSQ